MDNVNSQWSSRRSNNFINNITNNHKCCVFSSTKNQRINTTGNAFTNAASSSSHRQILGLVPDRPIIPDDLLLKTTFCPFLVIIWQLIKTADCMAYI